MSAAALHQDRRDVVRDVVFAFEVKAPPDWLTEAMVLAVESLKPAVKIEGSRHTRRQARDRLSTVRRAIAILVGEGPHGGALLDVDLLAHLNQTSPDGLPKLPGVLDGLQDLLWRAERAYAAVPPGKGRLRGPVAIDPKSICAIWIAESWLTLKGSYPGGGTLAAFNAAEKLWRAAGLKPLGPDDLIERWRRSFEKQELQGRYPIEADRIRDLVRGAEAREKIRSTVVHTTEIDVPK